MSYFSTALTRIAEQRMLSHTDIAKVCGLSRGFLSRLFSGESSDLSDKNFIALLSAFAADPNSQAELIAARCMDARIGPGADMVEIKIKTLPSSPPVGERTEVRWVSEEHIKLSSQTERAFAWLRSQCPLNPDLEKHLVGYAKLTGMR